MTHNLQIIDKSHFYQPSTKYLKKSFSEFAALEMIDRTLVEMDKNDIPINIYLDLSKVFNTLDHIILLEKLNYYGINGVALKLMDSYLTNPTQYVEIN